MSKQTAMQDLLEFCKYRQTKAADSCKSAWNMILSKIKDDGLLEREKEQIIDAFMDSRILSITNNISSGKQYYKETFKNK